MSKNIGELQGTPTSQQERETSMKTGNTYEQAIFRGNPEG